MLNAEIPMNYGTILGVKEAGGDTRRKDYASSPFYSS